MKQIASQVLSVLLVAATLTCLPLGGCGRREERIGAAERLAELREACAPLPDGTVYRSGAEEGEAAYLSPSLRDTLYGTHAEAVFAHITDYAVYLSSFATPTELAVFCCDSVGSARQAESLCRERADTLRIALRGTAFETMSDGASVVCRGKTVIMTLTESPEEAREAALRLLR